MTLLPSTTVKTMITYTQQSKYLTFSFSSFELCHKNANQHFPKQHANLMGYKIMSMEYKHYLPQLYAHNIEITYFVVCFTSHMNLPNLVKV